MSTIYYLVLYLEPLQVLYPLIAVSSIASRSLPPRSKNKVPIVRRYMDVREKKGYENNNVGLEMGGMPLILTIFIPKEAPKGRPLDRFRSRGRGD